MQWQLYTITAASKALFPMLLVHSQDHLCSMLTVEPVGYKTPVHVTRQEHVSDLESFCAVISTVTVLIIVFTVAWPVNRLRTRGAALRRSHCLQHVHKVTMR